MQHIAADGDGEALDATEIAADGQGVEQRLGRVLVRAVADDPARSVIKEQVEMGVAVRMAVLDILSRGPGRNDI